MHPDPGPRDERTTPRWLQLPSLAGVALLAAWFSLSYTFALGAPQPEWARGAPWVWWLASWEMFTLDDPVAALVEARAQVEGGWVPVDLPALFPTRWESGPRYARSAFFRDPASMRVLGAATCRRLPMKARRIRFELVKWDKTLGLPSRTPPADARREFLLDWPCARSVALPGGVRL